MSEKMTWHTEKRKVSELVPAEWNPRQMTKEQADALRASIETFDLVEIPAINTDNMILAGHQRVATLALLGRMDEEIDVRVPNRALTIDEAMRYNVTSNKVLGEFDMDKLLAMPEEILKSSGFSEKDIRKLVDGHTEAKEDDYDVDKGLEIPPRCENGDVFQCGRHMIACGDSRDKIILEKLMGGVVADMLFSDPPYGVAYKGKTKDALEIENDALSEEETEDLWNVAYANTRAFLKDGGSIFVTVPPGPLHLLFARVLKERGDLRQILVWVKDRFVLGRSDYHYRHEPILYGWKSTGSHEFYGGRDKDTVWEIERPSANKEHPTMKPIALIAKAIQEGSKKDGIVIDPFLGSGSTMLACEETGRTCYGVEIDPKYCTVILDRWEKLTGQKAIKVQQ